jgi:preprotein translocase subunit SecB
MNDTAAENPRQILLQRIYLKDASVEVPLAPQIFARIGAPHVDLQVGTTISQVDQLNFQVLLAVTVTAKFEEETAFLVEIHQGGVFEVRGFAADELAAVLATYCPNVIFPYAREAVSSLVSRTGFPPILLQPINFDALYQEYRAREQQAIRSDGGVVVQ